MLVCFGFFICEDNKELALSLYLHICKAIASWEKAEKYLGRGDSKSQGVEVSSL